MRLSIVIPACNEEKRIRRMLDAYLPHLSRRYGGEVEVIVVINGSTDGTEAIVREYMAQHPLLRAVVDPDRIGKGGALMRGFAAARGDLIGFLDADGATPPEAFDDLVLNIGDAGAIIASRWRRESKVSPRQPLDRRIASRLFNLLVRLAFGLRLTDTQCGAKLMRGDAVRRVLPDLGITQWAFDIDLLFQLRRAGCRIMEIPTTWHDVAGSKVEVVRASCEMLVALLRLRLVYSPFRWVVDLYNRYLGPFIHPSGMEPDRLFRHSLIVLFGSHTANLFNLLFQITMVAMLGNAEYGVLSAMLGTAMVLAAPLGALQQSVAHFTAIYVKQNRRGRVAGLVRRLTLHLVLCMVPLVALGVATRHGASDFFRMDQPGPLLLTGLAMVAMFCMGPMAGALTGLQAFVWGSTVGVGASALRVAVAVALVAAGGKALGALTGHALSMVAGVALSAYALRRSLGAGKAERGPVGEVYLYGARYMLALAGFAVLSNMDVPMVKHYFAPEEAGLFAKAAMVARVVILLPMPVAGALFPKVVSAGRTTAEHLRTLAKGAVLVLLMVGGVALVCLAFPEPLLRLFRAGRAAELAPYVRGMTLALLPQSLLFLLLSFELAQRRFAITIPLLLGAAGYVGAVVWRHPTIGSVVGSLAAGSWLALALGGACVAWGLMRERTRAPAAARLQELP